MIAYLKLIVIVSNVNAVIKMEIIRRLTAFVPCHRRPDRSIHFRGQPFPLCARCMSILLGFLLIPILFFLPVTIPIWIGILLQLPMVVDGVTQKYKFRESNNFLRVITGGMSGIGLSIMTIWGSRFLVETINRLI